MQVQPDPSLFGPGDLEAEDSLPRGTLRARVLDEREGERTLSRTAPGTNLYGGRKAGVVLSLSYLFPREAI